MTGSAARSSVGGIPAVVGIPTGGVTASRVPITSEDEAEPVASDIVALVFGSGSEVLR
jgi:hypothetical protein